MGERVLGDVWLGIDDICFVFDLVEVFNNSRSDFSDQFCRGCLLR